MADSASCNDYGCPSTGLCSKQSQQQIERMHSKMHCSLSHQFAVSQRWNTGWQSGQCEQQMITGRPLCDRNLSHFSHSRFIYTHTSSVSSSPLLSQIIITMLSFCCTTCSCYSLCLKSTLSAWDYMSQPFFSVQITVGHKVKGVTLNIQKNTFLFEIKIRQCQTKFGEIFSEPAHCC